MRGARGASGMVDTLKAPALDQVPSLPAYNASRIGFAAGVVSAAVMLAPIVLLRVLSGAISLPEVVAEGLLMNMPGALFSTVLDSLQHAAKPLFYLAVGIGALVVGGLLGRVYARQPTFGQVLRIVVGVWLATGLGVYTVLGAGLFGQHLQAGAAWHAVSLLVVVGVFGVALFEAYTLLAGRALRVVGATPVESRRTLLRNAVAAVVATIATGSVWRLMSGTGSGILGQTPSAVGAETAAPPNSAPFDVKGVASEVTPTGDFYLVSKNFIDPSVASGGWRLKVDGLVDQPMELSYEQLKSLPASEGYYTLMCISNEVGGDLWGTALWRGVKLKDLLELAGVHPDGVKAIFTGADDYRDSVTLARALNPETLLAWEMNGQPLRTEHGYPARLLIPGIYGMKNVKWLTGISIVANDFHGFWQTQGWDDAAPYQTESRIDAPRARESVSAGVLAVGGVAFAGDRGIQSVEVSTDAGQTWQAAQVKPGLSSNTWQLWRADVRVDRSIHEIRVRATDGLGHLQTREQAPPFPAGATGYHTITIAVS
ncbi:MAG: molybdopterin-dependent oxidoreductase [Chloroflexota bacterium]|nr:molybdopterin-dependent oxidoreductase [Chloroflexota bacterium]